MRPIVHRLAKAEDILTFVVRTLHAVFVPDVHKPLFLSDCKAADAGNIRVFLAVPLVGSTGRAIATFQLSFPDDSLLDRESFGLWVLYAQRVADALERTQEAEEREITDKITREANELMWKPMTPQDKPWSWCNAFLTTTKDALGADGMHMRVLKETTKEDVYELVGAVGHLAALRFSVRPTTREGDGSCSRALLHSGGKITYKKEGAEGTGRLNERVKALENDVEDGKAFADGLG